MDEFEIERVMALQKLEAYSINEVEARELFYNELITLDEFKSYVGDFFER